jgi:O-antigen ligase
MAKKRDGQQMSDRALRRQLEREQRKHRHAAAPAGPGLFDGTPAWWLVLLAALPLVAVPLWFVYLAPGMLIEGGYGQIIINEFQKYVAELVSLGLLLGAATLLLARRNLWPRLPRSIVWPVLLYLLGVAGSLLAARDLPRGLLIGLEVSLLPVLFFLLIAGLRWRQAQVLSVLALMAGAGALISLIGICQKLEVWEFALLLPHGGAGSLLFFQNLAGEYLIVLIPPVLVLLFMPIHWALRAAAALLGSLFLVHLVMTLARGAWVGLFGGVVVAVTLAALGIYRAKRTALPPEEGGAAPGAAIRVPGRFLAAAVLILILFVGAGLWARDSDSPYVRELLSINLSNTTGRLQIWQDSLELLKDHWLLGVGPGHYKVHISAYLEEIPKVPYLFQWDENSGRGIYPFRPHNDYLQNWIELGLFGLLGMLWLFAAIARIATRGIGRAALAGDRGRALLILGTFGGFAAWAVSMLFEFPYQMPASLLLGWFCAGMTVALSLPTELRWKPLRVSSNRLAGAALLLLTVCCFSVAHLVFWGNLYGLQAMAAWNNKNLEQGYRWQQQAYDYTPWEESNGPVLARMELGLQKYQESLRTSREVVARNPHLLPALWTRGIAAATLGHGEESRAAFGTIIETFPFLPENAKYRKLAGLAAAEQE